MLKEEQRYETEPYYLVGKPVTRLDGREKVTGSAIYTHDLKVPNMLYGKIKRSTKPHAEIVSIDTSRALKLKGVRAVITGRDVPNTRRGVLVKDTPVLAVDRVRYVAEPVAAVAAETPEIAEEALDLIDVEYRELPAIFDPEEAMKKEPIVVIHPDFKSYTVKYLGAELGIPNLHAYFKVRKGDVEKGFEKCDQIVENSFRINMVHAFHLEPIVSMARVEPNGGITIWESTQHPYMLRNEISEALQIPLDKINVIVPHVGGGFGNKLVSVVAPITVALAKQTRRPVKIAFSRREVFEASYVRQPFTVHIKDGVTRDGRIVARKMTSIISGGGYSGGMGVNETKTSNCGFSHYKVDNFHYDAYRVYTNRVPGGPYRGFGAGQVNWAVESQMDMIAERLGLDPVEVRLRNLVEEGDKNVIGETMRSAEHKNMLRKAKELIGWGQKRSPDGPWRFGKGVASGHKWSFAPTASSAMVKYSFGGFLDAFVSTIDMGTGAQTILAQIAGEVLRIPLEKIRVSMPNTNFTPFSDGGFSSRQTYNDGNAVRLAALDLKKQIVERAAGVLGVDRMELDVREEKVYSAKDPKKAMKIDDLFMKGVSRGGAFAPVRDFIGAATWFQESGPLRAEDGQCTTDRACSFYDVVSTAAEVAVNIETGQIKILKIAVSVDPGTVLNPLLFEGQVQGSAFMAFSNTLFEDLVFEDGGLVNAELADYKIAGSKDAPEIVVSWGGSPFSDGPFGAKGIGEGPMLPTPAAIGNAVYDAIGVRIPDLPVTAEKVLVALKEKRGSG
ncbi:MAG: xanthine dehydrogenase family protein molybdopterin-binding subunit [Thaumarchaeota archaeon]|nr:xanthine dehydrogenase family protein molybdopterin-binding subunit [Nitrososphaerota archaeon]